MRLTTDSYYPMLTLTCERCGTSFAWPRPNVPSGLPSKCRRCRHLGRCACGTSAPAGWDVEQAFCCNRCFDADVAADARDPWRHNRGVPVDRPRPARGRDVNDLRTLGLSEADYE